MFYELLIIRWKIFNLHLNIEKSLQETSKMGGFKIVSNIFSKNTKFVILKLVWFKLLIK